MKKFIILLYFFAIGGIILLGIINKRSIEDIIGALITAIILIGVFSFFNKIMN